jgi:Holliday junction resolvase-like predicted endonuclease
MIERRVLVSLLKLTRHGPVQRELLIKDARIPKQIASKMLERFCASGFCQLRRGVIDTTSTQRVKVAVHAIKLGADFEHICGFLQWKEFETLASEAFKANYYKVTLNFRFKHVGKRWEIDLLAFKEPLIVCVDCKHWHHGWSRAAIIRAVEAQTKRAKALANAFPTVYKRIRIDTWNQALFVPAILSLIQGPFKFYNKVPIVPVLQLQNFLNELPAHVLSLTHFRINNSFKEFKLTKLFQ